MNSATKEHGDVVRFERPGDEGHKALGSYRYTLTPSTPPLEPETSSSKISQVEPVHDP